MKKKGRHKILGYEAKKISRGGKFKIRPGQQAPVTLATPLV